MADDKIKPSAGVVDAKSNSARQGTSTVYAGRGPATTIAHGEAQKPAGPAYVPTYGPDGLAEAAAKLKAQKKPDAAKKPPITEIPSYDEGTDYVPNDQVAQLHQGEAVVPADQNPNNTDGAGVTGAQQLLQEQPSAPIQGAPASAPPAAPAPQQPKSLLGRIAQAVVDGVPPLLVVRRRDQAARLVHRHDHARHPRVAHAIDFDAIDARAYRELRVRHALAVHAHASFRHPARGLRPRTQAKLGDGARDAVARRGGDCIAITWHVISM